MQDLIDDRACADDGEAERRRDHVRAQDCRRHAYRKHIMAGHSEHHAFRAVRIMGLLCPEARPRELHPGIEMVRADAPAFLTPARLASKNESDVGPPSLALMKVNALPDAATRFQAIVSW